MSVIAEILSLAPRISASDISEINISELSDQHLKSMLRCTILEHDQFVGTLRTGGKLYATSAVLLGIDNLDRQLLERLLAVAIHVTEDLRKQVDDLKRKFSANRAIGFTQAQLASILPK